MLNAIRTFLSVSNRVWGARCRVWITYFDKLIIKGLHTRVRTRENPHSPIMLFYHNTIFVKKQTFFHKFFKKKKFYFFKVCILRWKRDKRGLEKNGKSS